MSEPDTLRPRDPLLPPRDPESNGNGPTRKALAWLGLATLLICLIAWLAWIAGWSWIP